MNLELNVLENSLDYLYNSMDYYKIADSDETHDPQRANVEYKKKWKMAFVLLVQASELLLKESLRKISMVLIYENIDNPNIFREKTVSFGKLINRTCNFRAELLSEDEKEFMFKCGSIRNELIHHKVDITSSDIKSKYCKLYSLYIKLYKKVLDEELTFSDNKYFKISQNILVFSEGLYVFRGVEHRKEDLEWFKEELEKSQELTHIGYVDGKEYERIRYGSENVFLNNKGMKDYCSDIFEYYDYCADCAAKQGEYHLTECDWEVCPRCGHQLIGCDCEAECYCALEEEE